MEDPLESAATFESRTGAVRFALAGAKRGARNLSLLWGRETAGHPREARLFRQSRLGLGTPLLERELGGWAAHDFSTSRDRACRCVSLDANGGGVSAARILAASWTAGRWSSRVNSRGAGQ